MIGLSRRRNSDFQPCAVTRSRFYREFGCQQAYSFPDHRRSLARRLQFRIRQPSGKRKSLTVILHRQLQIARPLRQSYQHMLRSTVFAHIHQTFLHNARQFPAPFLRQIHPLHFADELGCDSRLPPEALHRVGNETQKPVRIDLERFHRLHQFAQLQNFLAQQLLDPPQLRIHRRRLRCRLAPQHIQLHFHCDQRLNRSIMKFAREPSPLQRSRPLPQPPHEVHVVDLRTHLLRVLLQKPQFLFRCPHHLWIEQEHTARPLPPEDQPHRNYGVKLFHSRQRIEKSRAFIAQPPSVTIQQHRIKTLVTARRINRVRGRLEQVRLFAFRRSLAPAQRFAALAPYLGKKYPVTVPLLRGAEHPGRAVDVHHFPKNLLHGPSQSRLHSRRTENAHDHGALRPHLLLVLRHVAQQKSEHNQIHRAHEQLLRIQFPHAHTQPR